MVVEVGETGSAWVFPLPQGKDKTGIDHYSLCLGRASGSVLFRQGSGLVLALG